MKFPYIKKVSLIPTTIIATVSFLALALLFSSTRAQGGARQPIDLNEYYLYNKYEERAESIIPDYDKSSYVSKFFIHDGLAYIEVIELIEVTEPKDDYYTLYKQFPPGQYKTKTHDNFEIEFYVNHQGFIKNLKLTDSGKKSIERFKRLNKKTGNCQKAAFYHYVTPDYIEYKKYPSLLSLVNSPKHEEHKLANFIVLLQKDDGKILATTMGHHGYSSAIRGRLYISINKNGLFIISDKKDRRNADFMIDNCVVTQLNKNKKLHINKINTNLVLPSFDMAKTLY